MRARYVVSLCVLAAAVVITGAVLLAAYGVIRHVSVAVEDASLTRFELATYQGTALLAYKLSLALVVRNPNWAMSINNTEALEAAYYFDGQQFYGTQVSGSHEGDKLPARKTRVYRLVTGTDGNLYVVLRNAAAAAEYRKQNATGTFELEVKLTGGFRYTARSTRCKLEATCPLRLKLARSSAPWDAVGFETVKCRLAKPEKYC